MRGTKYLFLNLKGEIRPCPYSLSNHMLRKIIDTSREPQTKQDKDFLIDRNKYKG